MRSEGPNDLVGTAEVRVGPDGFAAKRRGVLGELLECLVLGGRQGCHDLFAARCGLQRRVIEASAAGRGLEFGAAEIERPGFVADRAKRGKGSDAAETLYVVGLGRSRGGSDRGDQQEVQQFTRLH